MFTELNSILNSTPDSFTKGEFIFVSDRQSDASFLIHHFLSFYLRARCKVCFLGLVQSFSHYCAISQRLSQLHSDVPTQANDGVLCINACNSLALEVLLQILLLFNAAGNPKAALDCWTFCSLFRIDKGVSLAQAKEKGQLIFLEGLKESLSILIPQEGHTENQAMDFLRDPTVGLRSLYKFVQSSLNSSSSGEDGTEEWGPSVLLVDDISVLLSLGVSARAVLDFSHYCKATVCSQLQGNMVMLVRCDGEDEGDDGDDEGSELLLRGLTHQCSLTLHVQGLPTGYCRDIHGQVEVCWRRRQGDGQHTQKKLFQYKVHDKGASFFARGTSSAVL